MPGARTQEQIEAALLAGDDEDLLNEELDPVDDTAAVEAERARVAAEAEASRKGWTPKDKFKGDPDKWVDAQTFVERGERFTKNLQREIATLKADAEANANTRKEFAKFMQERLDAKDAELKDAIQQLRIQRSAATRDGDDELAIQLEDRIELLQDQRKETKEAGKEVLPTATPTVARDPGPNPDDPVLLEWIEDGNQWFQDDPKLQAYSIAVGEELIKNAQASKTTLARGRPFLDLVRQEMEKQFPRRFAAKADAKNPPAVETGSRATSPTGGHTVRDLPAEDRKLMRQFIADGLTTEEKFLENYFGSPDKGRRHS